MEHYLIFPKAPVSSNGKKLAPLHLNELNLRSGILVSSLCSLDWGMCLESVSHSWVINDQEDHKKWERFLRVAVVRGVICQKAAELVDQILSERSVG